MDKPAQFSFKLKTKEYSLVNPTPPFVDVILRHADINRVEFDKLVNMAHGYRNDPRLVEMVRHSGDSSAKVAYLIDVDETQETILAELRRIAAPHVKYLNTLPEQMQTTIHTLLSINKVPTGLDLYAIPALLEIDRVQREMIAELKQKMAGRKLAEEYYKANVEALRELDEDWPHLHHGEISYWPKSMAVPESPRMNYEGFFEHDRLAHLFESCVIVQPPQTNDFVRFIPPVLRRPLPQSCPVPQTGSADWLIREVGKVGRQITRALLSLISQNLEREKIRLEASNYELITRKSRESLDEMISRLP